MVGRFYDTVHYGVAEMHVRRRHVDFRAQHAASFLEFAGVHALEKVEVFLRCAAAVGTVGAGLRRSAFLSCNLFAGLVVHVGFAFFYEPYSEVEQLGEVVGGIVFTVAPVETEPMDVVADGVDVFHVLFHWICVVETQVASASKAFCDAEIHADRFRMADVEVSVGFRWKTCIYPSSVASGLKVVPHLFFHEIHASSLGIFLCGIVCHNGDVVAVV